MRPPMFLTSMTLVLATVILTSNPARADEPGADLSLYTRSAQLTCLEGPGCTPDRETLKLAIKADPNWSSATGKMTAGIVVTSLGGATALVLGFVALMNALSSTWDDYDEYGYDSTHNDDTPRTLGIASLGCLVVGLGVGLPLLVSGVKERRQIRHDVMQRLSSQRGLSLAGGPGQAGLGLRYSF